MKYLIILAALTLVGCKSVRDKRLEAEMHEKPSEYRLSCKDVRDPYEGYFQRCENKETICYETFHGLSCFKKEVKKVKQKARQNKRYEVRYI